MLKRDRVDNFIPGKLEELGLGYKVFAETNPSIIHASISGTIPSLATNGKATLS